MSERTRNNIRDILAIMPADGWCVRRSGGGETWDEPLVGWALVKDFGDLAPFDTEPEAFVVGLVAVEYGVEFADCLPQEDPPDYRHNRG